MQNIDEDWNINHLETGTWSMMKYEHTVYFCNDIRPILLCVASTPFSINERIGKYLRDDMDDANTVKPLNDRVHSATTSSYSI